MGRRGGGKYQKLSSPLDKKIPTEADRLNDLISHANGYLSPKLNLKSGYLTALKAIADLEISTQKSILAPLTFGKCVNVLQYAIYYDLPCYQELFVYVVNKDNFIELAKQVDGDGLNLLMVLATKYQQLAKTLLLVIKKYYPEHLEQILTHNESYNYNALRTVIFATPGALSTFLKVIVELPVATQKEIFLHIDDGRYGSALGFAIENKINVVKALTDILNEKAAEFIKDIFLAQGSDGINILIHAYISEEVSVKTRVLGLLSNLPIEERLSVFSQQTTSGETAFMFAMSFGAVDDINHIFNMFRERPVDLYKLIKHKNNKGKDCLSIAKGNNKYHIEQELKRMESEIITQAALTLGPEEKDVASYLEGKKSNRVKVALEVLRLKEQGKSVLSESMDNGSNLYKELNPKRFKFFASARSSQKISRVDSPTP